MAISRRQFIAASAATAGLALSPIGAVAENATEQSISSSYNNEAFDALKKARQYARSENAIGMVISYGEYDGAPEPEYVGERFKEKIADLGESSEYFIISSNKPGYAIVFVNPVTGTDAMNLSSAAQSISSVVKEKRRLSNLVADVSLTN